MTYPRRSFDVDAYVERVRSQDCFICRIVAGDLDAHAEIYRDEVCIAFLAQWPTLVGYTLVAPLAHRTRVVDDFTADEYRDLHGRMHAIGRAVERAVPTERLYVLSLGANDGNAHVHWHLAPLPPGVPYEEQQYAALMHETHGYYDVPVADQRRIAADIAAHIEIPGAR